MIERLIILVILSLLGVGAYMLLTKRQLKKASASISTEPMLAGMSLQIPTIVYFTTPTCAPCRLQLKPALDRLQAQLGDDGLQVIAVDATENPDIADRWGVFSVPTTFVLDQSGQPKRVYNGVVSEAQLKQQILSVTA